MLIEKTLTAELPVKIKANRSWGEENRFGYHVSVAGIMIVACNNGYDDIDSAFSAAKKKAQDWVADHQ